MLLLHQFSELWRIFVEVCEMPSTHTSFTIDGVLPALQSLTNVHTSLARVRPPFCDIVEMA